MTDRTTPCQAELQARRQALECTPMNRVTPPEEPLPQGDAAQQLLKQLECTNGLLYDLLSAVNALAAAALAGRQSPTVPRGREDSCSSR